MTLPFSYISMIISPLKWAWPFFWINLNSLYQRIICTKFDWFWLAGSGGDFFKIFSVSLLFHYYLPLENGYLLHLNKLEFPPPKYDLFQVWLKLAKWLLRRFLNGPIRFLHFCDYLPFEKDLALYLKKPEFPLPKDNVYQFDWIRQAGSGEKDFF